MNDEKQTSARSGNRAALRAGVGLGVFLAVVALFFYVDPADLYLWIKAFHIIAVISWMAAIFYLPRLFIYNTDAPAGSQQSETFKVMEQRLIKVIMNPAMMISWILGLY